MVTKIKKPKIKKITRQQFFRAWVRALESGKFRQTRDQLTKHGSYCCLGVACVVHSKLTNTPFYTKTVEGSPMVDLAEKPNGIDWQKSFGLDGGVTIRGSILRKHLPPVWNDITSNKNLVWLNDKERLSFKEIAKIIKLNWPQHFRKIKKVKE